MTIDPRRESRSGITCDKACYRQLSWSKRKYRANPPSIMAPEPNETRRTGRRKPRSISPAPSIPKVPDPGIGVPSTANAQFAPTPPQPPKSARSMSWNLAGKRRCSSLTICRLKIRPFGSSGFRRPSILAISLFRRVPVGRQKELHDLGASYVLKLRILTGHRIENLNRHSNCVDSFEDSHERSCLSHR